MRAFTNTTFLAGALLIPCLCMAQGTSGYAMKGPSLGLMFESGSAAIRPILGIPGAATLGAPLSPGFAVRRAVVAPGGDFALLISRDDSRLALIRAGGTAQWLAPATPEAPEFIAFSPRGRSAAVYYRASGRLMVLSGLRDQTPGLVFVDAGAIPAAPTQVVVSEDAASLLLAVPEGDGAALYYLPAASSANPKDQHGRVLPGASSAGVSASSGFARRLGTFQSVSGLRFAGIGADALVADGKANTVYLIQDVPGAAQISALGTAQDGLAQPTAVEAMDARRVLVVNAGGGSLTVLHRDGTPAASIQCGCTPAGLQQMEGNSIYRLTDLSKEPMWLLDAGGAEARIMAVPPDRSQISPAAEGAQR